MSKPTSAITRFPAPREAAPPDETTASADHIPALDGLRGVAIAMVMVFHFYVLAPSEHLEALDTGYGKFASGGWAGVDLFFVLSGFLITGILLESKGKRGYFSTFYARRALRILPLYYGFLGFLLFVVPHVDVAAEAADIDTLRHFQGWFWTLSMNVPYSIEAVAYDRRLIVNGHFWSLAIEEQFYIVWPLVVLLCSRRALVGVCVATIVGALALRIALVTDLTAAFPTGNPPYFATPARIDPLVAGALLAVLLRQPGALRLRIGRWAPFVATAAFGGLVAMTLARGGFDDHDDVILTAGLSLLALFGVSIVATLATRRSGPLVRALTLPPLMSLGKYSYAAYVFHLFVFFELKRAINEYAALPQIAGSVLAGTLALGLVAALTTYALAWLSWHLYEKRLLSLKRYFTYDEVAPFDVTERLATAA